MDIKFVDYQEEYRAQIEKLFESFQGYLVHIDPLKRLRVVEGYGESALNKTIKLVKDNEGVFYVALNGNTVIGFIAGIIEQLSEMDSVGVVSGTKPGRIVELYVDAQHRGHGTGTALMEKIADFFKSNSCDVMKVEVFAPNIPAHNLYKKLKFTERDIDLIKLL